MSSTTSRASLYKPASGENVNVVTDVNNNWDTVDLNLNFRTCTSSTRPSTKWDGLTIHETDTRKSYVWNSTPAVSGWYQIYTAEAALDAVNLSGATTGAFTVTSKTTGNANPRFAVRSDGLLAWGNGTASVDSYLYRSNTNALMTDGAFTVAGATTVQSTTDSTAVNVSGGGTFAKSLTVGGSASLGGGVGVVNLRNATTAPTGVDAGGIILTSESGRPKVYSPSGLVQRLSGATAISTTQTRATFTAEATLATLTIPANDATVGATYRIRAWGIASTTGTPTYTIRTRIGGVAGSVMATNSGIAATATITNRPWTVEGYLVVLTSGAAGSCMGQMIYEGHISTSGISATPERRMDGAGTISSIDWTASKDFVVTVQCSASSASNTITCQGAILERIS